MRPVTISQTGTGTSSPARLDSRLQGSTIGVACVVSGTVNYTLQHTYDEPRNFSSAADWNSSGTWIDSSDTDLVSATTTQDGYYPTPVEGSRVVVNSGDGSVTVTYIQGSKC